MIDKIVELVFIKAKKNALKNNKASLSKEISDNTNISKRTFERLYSKYIDKLEIKTDPTSNTIDELCKYLGYKNYADFVKNYQNAPKEELKNINTDSDKEKVTKVEITNFDKLHKSNKLLIITSVFATMIGLYLLSGYFTDKKAPSFTINNFNANTNYYYYTNPSGKLELTDNPKIANAKPLTYQVLNTYLEEKNIDTTQQNIKLIKAQYFDKGWKDKPLQELKPVTKQVKTKTEKSTTKKPISKPKSISNTIKIQLKDDALVSKISNHLQSTYKISNQSNTEYLFNGKTTYSFKESTLTKGRFVCTLSLNYTILTAKEQNIVKSDLIKINGTGFSKENAKQNAILKLKL